MSASQWFLGRLIPCVLVVVLGSLFVGLVRGFVLFVPGIMGMIAGGITGWITGRLGRGDPESVWSFTHRVWLALGAGLLYAVATVTVVSVINVGSMSLPLDWLADVIAGRDAEIFVGYSMNSWQATGGGISGGWWFIFTILDGVLFAFVFMVIAMVGWSGGGGERAATLASAAPLEPEHVTLPLPLISFGFLALVSLSTVLGLAMWPSFGPALDAGSSASQLIFELQGEWVFGEEAGFLGATDAERSFTLTRGLGSELAGFSKIPVQFMLSLEPPRRDGVFEGHLNLGGAGGILLVHMRPSEDRSLLAFVVDWWAPGGITEKHVTARRAPPQGS